MNHLLVFYEDLSQEFEFKWKIIKSIHCNETHSFIPSGCIIQECFFLFFLVSTVSIGEEGKVTEGSLFKWRFRLRFARFATLCRSISLRSPWLNDRVSCWLAGWPAWSTLLSLTPGALSLSDRSIRLLSRSLSDRKRARTSCRYRSRSSFITE